MAQNIYEIMAPHIPTDHCHQSTAAREVAVILQTRDDIYSVLDLGCGDGRSADLFLNINPKIKWVGVDIEDSPEVASRTRDDVEFVTYDGVSLPFADGAFDMVYSYQVFEHVRHPEAVLSEIKRVLRPGGVFIGQTSQLEPYHSFSIWNFTIYGFKVLCETAGFELKTLRPGIDGITLIKRSYLGRPPEFSKWFSEESPLNQKIHENAQKKSGRTMNFRKLMYCGQFVFVCAA